MLKVSIQGNGKAVGTQPLRIVISSAQSGKLTIQVARSSQIFIADTLQMYRFHRNSPIISKNSSVGTENQAVAKTNAREHLGLEKTARHQEMR